MRVCGDPTDDVGSKTTRDQTQHRRVVGSIKLWHHAETALLFSKFFSETYNLNQINYVRTAKVLPYWNMENSHEMKHLTNSNQVAALENYIRTVP
jgi:hypothetical protein